MVCLLIVIITIELYIFDYCFRFALTHLVLFNFVYMFVLFLFFCIFFLLLSFMKVTKLLISRITEGCSRAIQDNQYMIASETVCGTLLMTLTQKYSVYSNTIYRRAEWRSGSVLGP